MTRAKAFIRGIISSFKKEEIIDNKHIKELVKYHPTKNINIDNIEWFKMKTRAPYNTLALFYKYKDNNKEDDISWILCIKNLYGKYKRDKEYINDVRTAFRNESFKGKQKQFFKDNTWKKEGNWIGICNHCHIECKVVTDHKPPFVWKKIFDKFCEDNNIIDLSQIDIYENENYEIHLKDKKLAAKWLEYHDSVAKFRTLCRSHNSHFGSYGYK